MDLAMNSNAKKPPLRWIIWPFQLLQRAEPLAAPQQRWLVAQRNAGVTVIAARALPRQRDRWQAWLGAIRQTHLAAALLLRLDELTPNLLQYFMTLGPLLLILLPPKQGGTRQWQRVRGLLAQIDAPHLRLSAVGHPPCQQGDFQSDVALTQPASTASMDARCVNCAVRERCAGPSSAAEAIAPLPLALSNQFDLIEIEASAANSAAICLQHHESKRYFTLQTERWSPKDIQTTLALGQIYLDQSEKARLDDFAKDLIALERDHPNPDVWRAADRTPFEQEEAQLRVELNQLRGVVIDVGAGPIRYLADLKHLMQNGQLHYIAVEPDADHLQISQRELPEGVHLRGTGENLPLADEMADAVMFLRSFNHLRDVDQALREAVRVLKPGGKLILVDNVAFGLLRTQAQAQRAHAIAVDVTPFEHYRNDNATQAIASLHAACGAQMRVTCARDVAVGRSNQWLVIARREDFAQSDLT